MAQRTNCDNCGGVLVDGKCPYCKAEWFKPGITIGNSGIVTLANVVTEEDYINCRSFADMDERFVRGLVTYTLELRIVGMQPEDLTEILRRLHESWGR